MNFKLINTFIAGIALTVLLAGSALAHEKSSQYKLAPERDYKGWAKFFTHVEKPATKQIREGFINPIGAKAEQGKSFPYGTVFVMEIYNAKADEKGELVKDSQGRLVKGDLSKIYVMTKKEGFSSQYKDQPHPTGDWEFRAYDDKNKVIVHSVKEAESCRVCHVPVAGTDFVLRYEEFFSKK